MRLSKTLSITYPISGGAVYVFVSVLKNRFSLRFESPQRRYVIFEVADPFLQFTQDAALDKPTKERLPDGFINKKVIFIFTFYFNTSKKLIKCKIISIEDNKTIEIDRFGTTVSEFSKLIFSPPRGGSLQIELFGFFKQFYPNENITIYRLLMEEMFANDFSSRL